MRVSEGAARSRNGCGETRRRGGRRRSEPCPFSDHAERTCGEGKKSFRSVAMRSEGSRMRPCSHVAVLALFLTAGKEEE